MNSWLHESDDARTPFTDITALDRIGQADEIADAVAFFASDDSRWITGQTLEVNADCISVRDRSRSPASRAE
jgi:3-oxoacyl-[acyl-carrier protein] reductase